MFKEIKDYHNTVTELKQIHRGIKNSTSKAYADFLKSLISVYNLWKTAADEDYKSKYPVFATKTIEKADPNDYESTVIKNLINEKPSDETLRYKYIYLDHYKDDSPAIVDLELLRELFLKNDFNFTIKYDELSGDGEYFYDSISISMYYKDLEAFLEEREKTR